MKDLGLKACTDKVPIREFGSGYAEGPRPAQAFVAPRPNKIRNLN